MAEQKHVPLIDFSAELAKTPEWQAPDGVHPTKPGRNIIAELVVAVVRPMIETPAN